jgi:hypothetical protein
MADVEKLQAEDPFRFQAYQLHQWKLQAAQAELGRRKTQAQEHHPNGRNTSRRKTSLRPNTSPSLQTR